MHVHLRTQTSARCKQCYYFLDEHSRTAAMVHTPQCAANTASVSPTKPPWVNCKNYATPPRQCGKSSPPSFSSGPSEYVHFPSVCDFLSSHEKVKEFSTKTFLEMIRRCWVRVAFSQHTVKGRTRDGGRGHSYLHPPPPARSIAKSGGKDRNDSSRMSSASHCGQEKGFPKFRGHKWTLVLPFLASSS